MYEDLIKDVENEIKDLKNDEDTLLYLARVRKTLIELKEQMKGLLNDLDELSLVGTVEKSEESILKLIEIMLANATLAVTRTKEFNLPIFTEGLYSAIKNPASYTIIPSPSGLAIIKINLDLTAGTLNDYATAIDETRQEMSDKQGRKGIGPYRIPQMSPDMASEMWRSKYYGPAREGRAIPQPKRNPNKKKKKRRNYNVAAYVAKYFETIKMRVSKFKGSAPFWRILNYGTTPLSSDWGGTAYPRIEPTHFVENSVKQFQAEMTEQSPSKNKPTYAYALDFVETLLTKINNAIKLTYDKEEQIGFAIVAEVENPKTRKEFTVVQVKKALGEKLSASDIHRVTQLVNDLAAGLIDPERRVELTKSGTGVRVRKRVKELYRIVQQFEEE
jgi:hypothetical protein